MDNFGYYTRNFIIYTGHQVLLGWLTQKIKEGRMDWACRYDGGGGKECIQDISQQT
jgi:hypothetical protein